MFIVNIFKKYNWIFFVFTAKVLDEVWVLAYVRHGDGQPQDRKTTERSNQSHAGKIDLISDFFSNLIKEYK